MDLHPGIVPKFIDELPMPDVDGSHLGGTPAQEHIGEPACGRAGVQTPPAGDLNAGEGFQRAVELVPGTAKVVRPLAFRDKQCVAVANGDRRLGEYGAAPKHATGCDQLRSMGPGARQPTGHQRLIEPCHRQLCSVLSSVSSSS